eukprot:1143013-Pelagomonas_calceolata.AAC.8
MQREGFISQQKRLMGKGKACARVHSSGRGACIRGLRKETETSPDKLSGDLAKLQLASTPLTVTLPNPFVKPVPF